MPVQLDDIVTLWMSGVLVIVAATIAPPVGLTIVETTIEVILHTWRWADPAITLPLLLTVTVTVTATEGRRGSANESVKETEIEKLLGEMIAVESQLEIRTGKIDSGSGPPLTTSIKAEEWGIGSETAFPRTAPAGATDANKITANPASLPCPLLH
jgi:hypothetical protein